MDTGFIIDNMKWSFSRINSFEHCPYGWYLSYILCNDSDENAFAQYGTYMHGILENYAKGNLSLFDISQYYEDHYGEAVTLGLPKNKYVDLNQKYYDEGLDYLDNINLDLDQYDVLGVEKAVEFKVGDYNCQGFIDLLLREKDTGKIIILDHKSAALKFKKNGDISKTDAKHYLEFKRQLYLYSIPIIEEYGHVDYLEWNMFRIQKRHRIPWRQEECDEAVEWAVNTIEMIRRETEWRPNTDSTFFCNNLCNQGNNACEYKYDF